MWKNTVISLSQNFKVDEEGVNLVRLRKKITRRVFLTNGTTLGVRSLDFPKLVFFETP